MYFSRVLFSIIINDRNSQFEECACLVKADSPEMALQVVLMEMKAKYSSFVNTNGDMVCWKPFGILSLEPIELAGDHIVLDSRLIQSISEYTLDHMYYKCTDLVNE